MELRSASPGESAQLVSLFASTFGASEGAEEGARIAQLVEALVQLGPTGGVRAFVALGDGELQGAILFSPLETEGDGEASLLSPVAVRTDRQGQGVGQALIRFGLRELESSGVRYVVTYGDPGYYSKVGFEPIDAEVLVPPRALSEPQGWIAQALGSADLDGLRGRCRCVEPFDDEAYW